MHSGIIVMFTRLAPTIGSTLLSARVEKARSLDADAKTSAVMDKLAALGCRDEDLVNEYFCAVDLLFAGFEGSRTFR
uniref:Uncharacterized protein n=1 Tax=Caenorhabditis japonica TaxID=281687 RepID=A0A8R1IJH1_CAEJA